MLPFRSFPPAGCLALAHSCKAQAPEMGLMWEFCSSERRLMLAVLGAFRLAFTPLNKIGKKGGTNARGVAGPCAQPRRSGRSVVLLRECGSAFTARLLSRAPVSHRNGSRSSAGFHCAQKLPLPAQAPGTGSGWQPLGFPAVQMGCHGWGMQACQIFVC